MYLGLLLIFIAIPLLEIALLVKVGQWLGFWGTLLIVIATGILGSVVLHHQGFAVFRRAGEALQRGAAPIAPVVDGFFLLIAGALLIAPGLITDALGLVLLIPAVRRRIAVFAVKKVMRGGVFRQEHGWQQYRRPPRDATYRQGDGARHPGAAPDSEGPVIDGEFQRLDERTVDPNKRKPSDSQIN